MDGGEGSGSVGLPLTYLALDVLRVEARVRSDLVIDRVVLSGEEPAAN